MTRVQLLVKYRPRRIWSVEGAMQRPPRSTKRMRQQGCGQWTTLGGLVPPRCVVMNALGVVRMRASRMSHGYARRLLTCSGKWRMLWPIARLHSMILAGLLVALFQPKRWLRCTPGCYGSRRIQWRPRYRRPGKKRENRCESSHCSSELNPFSPRSYLVPRGAHTLLKPRAPQPKCVNYRRQRSRSSERCSVTSSLAQKLRLQHYDPRMQNSSLA
mmetsp:Transcript_29310/g.89762  ORF Transcript_29310/g.89762 Transcript_29310/m.89762 type:complete len:215 (+) Transcript_29310:606-1250(+)